MGYHRLPQLFRLIPQAAGALRAGERGFFAVNHLAAATIAFRKVPLAINAIYGCQPRTSITCSTVCEPSFSTD